MKDYKSHTNYQLITSHRAQNFLLKPVHNNDLPPDQGEWKWNFSLESGTKILINDKFLTLNYHTLSTDPLINLFLESLGVLLVNRPVRALFDMKFREVESFLRDENHLESFSNTSNDLVLTAFSQVKLSLEKALLMNNLKTDQFPKDWASMTLVQKNRAVKEVLLAVKNSLFMENFPELVLAENQSVALKKNDSPMEFDLLQEIFREKFNLSDFKVVAVQ